MSLNAIAIDAVLPQTQCGECGYSGCLPYAKAIAKGETTIDRCPPGGENTLRQLAEITHQAAEPYLKTFTTKLPSIAVIDEALCIGCTKCIQACPVDAIVGAAKLMHTVIAEQCTGCNLCIPPCPMNCIDIISIPALDPKEQAIKANQSREAFQQRNARLAKDKKETQQKEKSLSQADINKKQAIADAIARVKAKRGQE